MNTFYAIDVETANSWRGSICQVGLVKVHDGRISDEWSTLVNPKCEFRQFNVMIHDISSDDVQEAPLLPEIVPKFREVEGHVLVSHTTFDRHAVDLAFESLGIPALDVHWLDSSNVVRSVWPERYERSGYGLANVSDDLGIVFNHHDALEDARAAAMIMLAACEESGTNADDWLNRKLRGIKREHHRRFDSQDIPNLEVSNVGQGEVVVFTGTFRVPRSVAKQIAEDSGYRVDAGVTKKTDILVVGHHRSAQSEDNGGSSKMKKARSLNEKGGKIRIVSNKEFFRRIV